MGRDNQPKVRQHFARKEGQRASYDRILIVSEGSKTEPNYFREIRREYRLHHANVFITPSEAGTAPINVVAYAESLIRYGDSQKHRIEKGAFEQVFCLIDRDQHESYHAALTLAESLDGKIKNDEKKPIGFYAIASIPSFELWLLLHFEDIHAPMHRDEVLRRTKGYIRGYDKGYDKAFAATKASLENAFTRAERLGAQHTNRSDPEPFTDVGKLVKRLMSVSGGNK